jgi:hypothetical protein
MYHNLHLYEAAIDAFDNLVTSTSLHHSIAATFTDANSCLIKQLKENSQALNKIRALLTKERNDRGARKPLSHSINNHCWTHGYNIARHHTSENCMYPNPRVDTRLKQPRTITWGSQASKE